MAHTVSIAQAAGTANSMERAKLALNASQTTVLRVTRIQYDDDYLPLAFEKVVLPLDRFPGLDPNGGDIPDIFELSQRHGLALGRATQRVSIIPATRDVALHLGIAEGTDAVKLDRVTETADGVPIEWRVAYTRKTA
jgi:DNA-binding GntR family transcriptional regulator